MRLYAAMKSALFLSLQYLLPQHLISRIMGKLAAWHAPKIVKNTAIHWFIAKYKVNMTITEQTNINDYPSFNSFFIRQLKHGLRPIAAGNIIASPVDGSISEIGKINTDKILQAKNRHYSLAQLLANDTELTSTFTNGSFATIYLSPCDYHRVHMPYTGKLLRSIYVPGKLFSVNPTTVQGIDDVFARNERLISIFATDRGNMAVILVGAMLVAGIHTTWQGQITPNRFSATQSWSYADKDIVLQKGDKLGYFNFGSTVIVLFPEDKITWLPSLTAKTTVKYGQAISKKFGE